MAGAREQLFVAQPLAYAGQRVIASPFQFAVSEDDNLQIVSANSAAGVVLAIQGRRLTSAGTIEPFAFVHTPNTDRSTKTENYKLGGGALLNLVIFASTGSPRIGQTYASARIIRGLSSVTVLLGALLGGYVTAAQPLAYPGSPVESSISGGGYLRSFYGSDPAPGAQVSETVPTGARWEVISFSADLATDGTVATRRPHVLFDDSFFTFMRSANPGTSPASNNQRFFWGQGLSHETTISVAAPQAGLLTNVSLLAGHRVTTSIDAAGANDNWSAPLLVVKEWLEVQS